MEYRAWNPFRSKLAAAILGGVDNIHMKPGSKVLYLGAASGTTVSHVSDIVGPVSSRTSLRYVDTAFDSTEQQYIVINLFFFFFFFLLAVRVICIITTY